MDTRKAIKFIKKNFLGRIIAIFSNYGSFLQIDLEKIDGDRNGIFIYMGDWIICHYSYELLNSNSERNAQFHSVLNSIMQDDGSVIDLFCKKEEHTFIFIFSNGFSLKLTPNSNFMKEDMVNFFCGMSKKVLCYAPEYGFYWGR